MKFMESGRGVSREGENTYAHSCAIPDSGYVFPMLSHRQ
jgi:hypothetical protein